MSRIGALQTGLARRGLLLAMGLLAVLGTVVVGAAQREMDSFELRVQEEVRRQSQAGLGAADEVVRRMLDHVSTLHALGVLAHLEALKGGDAGTAALHDHMREVAREGIAGVLQVTIVGQDGTVTWSTTPGFERVNLSDREHIRVHVQGRLEPFVSAPLVGRVSGRASLQLTRPILDRGGAFRGVVVVSLDPVQISTALDRADPASSTVVVLLRADGTVLARSTDMATLLGRLVSPERMEVMLSASSGSGAARSSLTGEERFVAWRQIENWPLVLAHGVDLAPGRQEAAEHRKEVIANAAAAPLVLLFGLGCIALWASRRSAAAVALEAQQSRQRLEDLVEALPAGAYRLVLDAGLRPGSVQSAPVLRKITGLEGGEDWAWLLQEPQLRADLLRRVATEGHASAEYGITRSDGSSLYVRDEANLFQRHEDGRMEIVGLLSDVTRERELRAQALAGAKLATLGEMATGLAHEMNQPATAITLAADLVDLELSLLGEAVSPATRERVVRIAEQATRIRSIIDHIRIFGRADASEAPLEALDPLEIVEGARALVHGSLRAAGVTLSLDLPRGLPPVRGHRIALEQVLVNLMLNARDAVEETPPHARAVSVSVALDAAAHKVVMAVEDSGPGFSPTALAHAFEPFFTSKPPGKGTGLGLAIAYGTLQRVGGTISIRNRAEGGARVEVCLPLATTGTEPLAA